MSNPTTPQIENVFDCICLICKNGTFLSDPSFYETGDSYPYDGICKTCFLKLLKSTRWGKEIIKIPKYEFEYIKIPISSTIRNIVFSKDGFKCVYCKSTKNLTVDHIKPESYGGTLDIENLQTLCRTCNSRKNNKI